MSFRTKHLVPYPETHFHFSPEQNVPEPNEQIMIKCNIAVFEVWVLKVEAIKSDWKKQINLVTFQEKDKPFWKSCLEK